MFPKISNVESINDRPWAGEEAQAISAAAEQIQSLQKGAARCEPPHNRRSFRNAVYNFPVLPAMAKNYSRKNARTSQKSIHILMQCFSRARVRGHFLPMKPKGQPIGTALFSAV